MQLFTKPPGAGGNVCFKWNVSTTVGWIAMKFYKDIYGFQMMQSYANSDSLEHDYGWHLRSGVKYFIISWLDWIDCIKIDVATLTSLISLWTVLMPGAQYFCLWPDLFLNQMWQFCLRFQRTRCASLRCLGLWQCDSIWRSGSERKSLTM